MKKFKYFWRFIKKLVCARKFVTKFYETIIVIIYILYI